MMTTFPSLFPFSIEAVRFVLQRILPFSRTSCGAKPAAPTTVASANPVSMLMSTPCCFCSNEPALLFVSPSNAAKPVADQGTRSGHCHFVHVRTDLHEQARSFRPLRDAAPAFRSSLRLSLRVRMSCAGAIFHSVGGGIGALCSTRSRA